MLVDIHVDRKGHNFGRIMPRVQLGAALQKKASIDSRPMMQ